MLTNDFLCFQYFPEIVVQYFDIVPGVVLPVTVKDAYAASKLLHANLSRISIGQVYHLFIIVNQ